MAVQIPQPISGFPEYTPSEQILLHQWLGIIRGTYELYGFVPVETPAVERRSTLTAKGGVEHEVYGLTRLREGVSGDEDTDLALHFDLTVPLARYVSMNEGKLAFPFKRYQMQKVWRGERAQKGRFREFYQCDIDVIGKNSLPLLADAEMPSIIYRIFTQMQIGRFMIRVSNRKITQAFFAQRGVAAHLMKVAREIVDGLEKFGLTHTVRALCEQVGITETQARALIDELSVVRSSEEMMAYLLALPDGDGMGQGVTELRTVIDHMRMLGVPDHAFRVDPLVMRGLDYYTGTVYETLLLDRPGLGSICSGGRYDDLAGFFTSSHLPGVGISIGLTRLFSELKGAFLTEDSASTIAPVFVIAGSDGDLPVALQIAEECRKLGIAVESSLQTVDISKQVRYAVRRKFTFVVIVGGEHGHQGQVRVKDLRCGTMHSYLPQEVPTNIQYLLQLTA